MERIGKMENQSCPCINYGRLLAQITSFFSLGAEMLIRFPDAILIGPVGIRTIVNGGFFRNANLVLVVVQDPLDIQGSGQFVQYIRCSEVSNPCKFEHFIHQLFFGRLALGLEKVMHTLGSHSDAVGNHQQAGFFFDQHGHSTGSLSVFAGRSQIVFGKIGTYHYSDAIRIDADPIEGVVQRIHAPDTGKGQIHHIAVGKTIHTINILVFSSQHFEQIRSGRLGTI